MKMDFKTVDSICTETANCVFAKLTTKKKVRDTLLIMVAQACVTYNNDPSFKNIMDKIARDPSVLNPLPDPVSFKAVQ